MSMLYASSRRTGKVWLQEQQTREMLTQGKRVAEARMVGGEVVFYTLSLVRDQIVRTGPDGVAHPWMPPR